MTPCLSLHHVDGLGCLWMDSRPSVSASLRSQEKARQEPGALEQHQKRDVAMKKTGPTFAQSSLSSGVTSGKTGRSWEIPWEEYCDVDLLGVPSPCVEVRGFLDRTDQAGFLGQS